VLRRAMPSSPEVVEAEFCELHLDVVLRSSAEPFVFRGAQYQGEHPIYVQVILQKRHGVRLGMRRSSVGRILRMLER
jgi:hypothetical protein